MLERNAKMEAIIIYNDKKDREFLNLIDSKFPIFIEYIDSSTKDGKKKSIQIKSHWGARKEPFVIVQENEKIIKVFYSEKSNAIQQLIDYLND